MKNRFDEFFVNYRNCSKTVRLNNGGNFFFAYLYAEITVVTFETVIATQFCICTTRRVHFSAIFAVVQPVFMFLFLILRSGIKKIPASTYSCEAYIYPLQLFFLCLHLYCQINWNLYFVYDLQHLKKFQTKRFTLKNKNKTLNYSSNKKFSNDRAKFCRLTNAAVQIPLVSKYTQTCKNNKLFKETKINKLNHFLPIQFFISLITFVFSDEVADFAPGHRGSIVSPSRTAENSKSLQRTDHKRPESHTFQSISSDSASGSQDSFGTSSTLVLPPVCTSIRPRDTHWKEGKTRSFKGKRQGLSKTSRTAVEILSKLSDGFVRTLFLLLQRSWSSGWTSQLSGLSAWADAGSNSSGYERYLPGKTSSSPPRGKSN